MELLLLKSKIHQATVTGIDMHYEGSIVVDSALMEEVGLTPVGESARRQHEHGRSLRDLRHPGSASLRSHRG